MEVNIRTDEHTLTAKFSGKTAMFITAALAVNSNVKAGTNKDGNKVFTAIDDCKFNLENIGVDMSLYLFKGFYAVVNKHR